MRIQGKGTFVAQPKVAQVLQLSPTPGTCAPSASNPRPRSSTSATSPPTRPLARRLGISPGGRVLRIHRLRLANGEPMSIDTTHLPARRFPRLRRELERTPRCTRRSHNAYGVQLTEAEETIETVLATPYDAQVLGVDVGLPMLLLTRHAFDADGQPGRVGPVPLPRRPLQVRHPAAPTVSLRMSYGKPS